MDSSVVPANRRKRATSLIGAFLLTFNFGVVTLGMGFSVSLGPDEFGVSTATYLIWYTVYSLAMAVAYPVMGRLMQRIGIRFTVLSCGLVFIAAVLVMGLVPNLVVFYVAAAVAGVSNAGTTMVASSSRAVGWSPSRTGTVMGFIGLAAPLSGMALGGVYPKIQATWGFTGIFVGVAVSVTVLVVLNALFLIHNPVDNATPVSDRSTAEVTGKSVTTRAVPRGAGLSLSLLAVAAACFGFEAVFGSVQTGVFRSENIDAATIGVLVGFVSISGAIGKPILGFMADRFGLKTLIVALSVLYTLGLPSLAVFGSAGIWVFFVLLPVVALSFSIPTIILTLLVKEVVGSEAFSFSFAITMSTFFLGQAVAVPLWGANFDYAGNYHIAMVAAGLLGLTGVLLAAFAVRFSSKVVREETRDLASELEPETEPVKV